jgi:hypothetical protein
MQYLIKGDLSGFLCVWLCWYQTTIKPALLPVLMRFRGILDAAICCAAL